MIEFNNAYDLLNHIQKTLKAPKNQYNKFGEYYYRSCEDILEAVKPLLGDGILILSDEVVSVGNWNYVKATATLWYGEDSISNTAYAREQESRPKMDSSQLTGGASTYARKYALNGLFLIDDTRDADATNDHGKGKSDDLPQVQMPNAKATQTRIYNDIMACKTDKELTDTWASCLRDVNDLPVEFRDALEMARDNRKGAIEAGDDSPVGTVFNGVEDSRAKARTLLEEMDRCSTLIELSNWITLNQPTINNLKGTSKAGTDKDLFMARVKTKREALIAASKPLTAAG